MEVDERPMSGPLTADQVRAGFVLGAHHAGYSKGQVARFDAWLAEVKAAAWDEGQRSGAHWGTSRLDEPDDADPPSSNPYQEET